MMLKLWKDDCGALIATEWLFVATILVLGVIVGLVGVRNFVNAGLQEFANAVGALNQSYSFCGLTGCCSSVAGSHAMDTPQTRGLTSIGTAATNISVPVPCG
jgi:hypothetical protein